MWSCYVQCSSKEREIILFKKRFCSCFTSTQSPTANYVNEGLKTSFFFYFSSSSWESRVLNSWILIPLRFKSCLNEYEVFITWKESIFLLKLYTNNNSNSQNKERDMKIRKHYYNISSTRILGRKAERNRKEMCRKVALWQGCCGLVFSGFVLWLKCTS